jgi:rRNA maturation endonuclease Nob1
VVDFTAQNVNAYKNLNTKSLFDRRLASSARRVTPDGTGKAIVDGSYKCFAPGSAQRIDAIKKVYQDLDRLRVRVANSTGERREEARKDLREKDDERAILVAEHYMICEKWFEDFAKRSQTPTQTTVTTTTTAPAQRGL